MKRCCKCKLFKNLSEFTNSRLRLGGKAPVCKSCHNDDMRHHYRNNRDAYRQKQLKKISFLKRFVDDLKRGPCVDCGQKFNPWQMDFDHRDAKIKIGDISRVRRASVNKLMTELQKCDLVCANCHRDRTHHREMHG